jgi:hypothetical protein
LNSKAQTRTWTGNSNTFWGIPDNWNPNIVPTASNDVIIPTGLTSYPVVTTSVNCKNLEIQGTGFITLTGTLNIYGSLTSNSPTAIGNGTSGTVIFRSGASTITTDIDLDKVVVNKTGTLTLSAGKTLNINSYLDIQNNNLDATASGAKVVLKTSYSSGNWSTAYIRRSLASTPPDLLGELHVQQYVVENYKTYHFLSPPVHDNGQTYHSTSSLEAFFDQTVFVNGSYAFPATGTIPDFTYYDETVEDPTATGLSANPKYGWSGLNPINSNTSRVEVGQGVSARFKPFTTGTTPHIIEWTGVANNGDITSPTITYTNYSEFGDGSNLIGNPYPSPIDWQEVYNDILEFPVIAVWQNDGTEYQGSYLIFDADDNGNSTLPNGVVAIGQAFFIEANSGSSSNILFKNKYRVNDLNVPFYRKAPINAVDLKLGGKNNKDLTLIHFWENNSENKLHQNRKKWMNEQNSLYTLNENLYLTAHNEMLPETEATINLGMTLAEAGNYYIELHQLNFINNDYIAFLEDKEAGKIVEINPNFHYDFIAEAGCNNERFILKVLKRNQVYQKSNNANQFAYYQQDGLHFQLADLNNERVEAILFDVSGKTIWQGDVDLSNGSGDIKSFEVPNGLLFLKVNQSNKESIFKVFK